MHRNVPEPTHPNGGRFGLAPDPSVIPVMSDGPATAESLDGGQCFRWNRDDAGNWTGVSGTMAATLGPTGAGLEARVVAGSAAQLTWHLAADQDWTALADGLPWRSDGHLRRCVEQFPGLRILRQPVGEALLCFLCSSAKRIIQIKRMAELLALRLGREIAPGIHALPTWEELGSVPVSALRGCGLGFRAGYVSAVARTLAARPGWLDETAALPYPEAHERLTSLPGVGAKIADCVLLFGAGRLEAFPVDVWLLRAMERRYGLGGWRPDQVTHFARIHFGPIAGLAQQYLFAWERRQSAATD